MSADTPNMKLRMPGKDYTDPGYYFCTLVTEGRRQLFGSVVAYPDAEHQGQDTQAGTSSACSEQSSAMCSGENVSHSPSLAPSPTPSPAPSSPPSSSAPLPPRFPNGHNTPYKGACVAYSPYGRLVARELEMIGTEGQYKGKVEIKGKVLLPDHIHILLHIKERIPKPLGFVINGFIVGCRRQWKSLCDIPVKQTEPFLIFHSCEEQVRTGIWNLPEGQTAIPMPQKDGALRIFEKGYNDNIVYRAGQLDGYYRYMDANPWRWLMKEKYPNLFCKTWAKELLPGHRFDLIGNMFLIDRPWRVPVRISRFAVEEEAFDPQKPEASFYEQNEQKILREAHYVFPRREKTAEEVQVAIETYLKLARKGAVLVTPCISPAEQQVVQAAYKEGLPVIMMSFNGFNKYYHPTKAHYDACARGILLQLAPWRYDPGRKMTKPLCEELNQLAFRFAGV